MMKPLSSTTLLATLSVLAISSVADAQLKWRVSVKVVLDENGDRAVDGSTFSGCCDLNTDAEIEAKIDAGNAILTSNGPADVPKTEERGYTLDLVEIVDLDDLPAPPSSVRACGNDQWRYCETANDCRTCVGGSNPGAFCASNSNCGGGTCTVTSTCDQVSHWFYAPINSRVRDAIRDAALVSPASKELYGWRDDAINIYILGSDGSGTSWGNVSVLLGQDLAAPNTPFHEIGHFMNLYHTHGGGGASPDCDTGWDDEVDDTLLDNCGEFADCGPCWDQDQIANWNYPTQCEGAPCDYAQLSSYRQHRVDQVYHNVMCYRNRREVLTPDQLDRMTDYSNMDVQHITNGRTRFVDVSYGGMIQLGWSKAPMRTVTSGVSIAAPGDIVLIRDGSYEETLTIDKDVTLRASGGDALIGGLP